MTGAAGTVCSAQCTHLAGAHALLAPELLRPPLVRLIALPLLALLLRLVAAGVERAVVVLVDIALVVLELVPPLAKVLAARRPAVYQVEVAILQGARTCEVHIAKFARIVGRTCASCRLADLTVPGASFETAVCGGRRTSLSIAKLNTLLLTLP